MENALTTGHAGVSQDLLMEKVQRFDDDCDNLGYLGNGFCAGGFSLCGICCCACCCNVCIAPCLCNLGYVTGEIPKYKDGDVKVGFCCGCCCMKPIFEQ